MTKHPGGAPPKYKSPQTMEEKIEAYFRKCDEKELPYTISGLAYWLGFVDRRALLDYDVKEEFSDTIKRAKLRIEKQRVEWLNQGRGSTIGQIFDLKNNFGWRDVTDVRAVDEEGKGLEQGSLEIASRLVTVLELARKRKAEQDQKQIPEKIPTAETPAKP